MKIKLTLFILILLLSACTARVVAQYNNQNIEYVIITKPTHLSSSDPYLGDLQFKVKLTSYVIWGDNPPEYSVRISVNNNYSWVYADSLRIIAGQFDGSYYCRTPEGFDGPYGEKDNVIYFWIYDQVSPRDFDKIFELHLTYNKPQVSLVSVEQGDQIPGKDKYVVYNPEPVLNLRGFSSFNWPDSTNSFIKEIQIKKEKVGFSEWISCWASSSGSPDNSVPYALNASGLELVPGLNTYYLRSIGKSAPNYQGGVEYSDVHKIELFYLGIECSDTICQVDSNIRITALPVGGIFEGNGIVDSTNWFNPSDAQENQINTISYKYLVDDLEFVVNKDVYVIQLPELTLAGEFEVCSNSTDKIYTIENPDTENYYYKWRFEGVGEVLDSNSNISRTVHWMADPDSYTGKIVISLESKNASQFCPAEFEFLVDIDPDPAPDKGCVFFLDQEKRLLASTVTLPAYYEWYMLSASGDTTAGFLGSGNTPYFFLTDKLIDDRKIDLANQKYALASGNLLYGCYTLSYMCDDESKAGLIPGGFKETTNNLSVNVTPNPSSGSFQVNLSGNYIGAYDLELMNLLSNSREVLAHDMLKDAELVSVNITTVTPPGIYLLRINYADSSSETIKIVIY